MERIVIPDGILIKISLLLFSNGGSYFMSYDFVNPTPSLPVIKHVRYFRPRYLIRGILDSVAISCPRSFILTFSLLKQVWYTSCIGVNFSILPTSEVIDNIHLWAEREEFLRKILFCTLRNEEVFTENPPLSKLAVFSIFRLILEARYYNLYPSLLKTYRLGFHEAL